MQIKNLICLSFVLAVSAPAFADFVDDEFNGTTLGSHWTWNPGTNPATEPTTSTYSVGNGVLTLTAAKGADQYANGDGGAYVEQDQPEDAEWSIETRIMNYNPVNTGYQHRWNKAGIALHQDNNHWIYIFITSDINGTQIHSYGQAQFDPTATSGGNQYLDEFQHFNIGYYNDYYLRLRKTVDGYLGELSYDQITWIPMTPLLRNPHSADGTLDGKIRLYTASGTPHEGRNTAPAEFDYIRKTTLSSPDAPFAEDEFDGTSAAEWDYALGDPAGAISFSNSAMLINPGATSPTGSNDIGGSTNPAAETGVIAYQDAPLGTNYSVYTKVEQTVFDQASRYRGHGIRIWQNQNCWLGIKILKNGSAPGSPDSRNLAEGMFVNDDNTTRANTAVFTSTSPTDPAPGYLRVDRNGNQFRSQFSHDGINWTPALTQHYPDGWVTLTLQPEQPLLVQLFSYLPATSNGTGTLTDTEFEFIRSIDISSIADWQLF